MAVRQSDDVNSRLQVPAKSRRAILTSIAAAVVAAPALAAAPEVDPIYPVWREWRNLEEEFAKLVVQSMRTWEAMPGWARNPQVLVLVGKNHKGEPSGNLHYATTPAEIRKTLGFDHPHFQAVSPETRARVEAKAAAFDVELQNAIEAADEEQRRCGYKDMEARLDQISNEQQSLLDCIEATPSRSPVALAAKIDIAFGMTSNEEALSDYPYCVYCSIVRAVYDELPADMQAALARAAALDGKVAELYWRSVQS
jgi:hypothetical protein